MFLHLFSLTYFTDWLALHRDIAYVVLFLGMFFETLIGTNVFIPGELFLLGGSILAGAGVLNIFLVAPVLYVGGAVGDSVNHYLGRTIGASLFKEHRKIFNLKNYHRGEVFFERHGSLAIFLARLIGPFNLITPFLSGVYRVPYRTFLLYNLAGVIVGISEFIAVGYFFGRHSQLLLFVMHRYVFALAIMFGTGYLAFRYLTKEKKHS